MTNSYDNHTFVICAYGESSYLEDCIQSLLNQSLRTKVILYTSTPNQTIQNLCQKYNLLVIINKEVQLEKIGIMLCRLLIQNMQLLLIKMIIIIQNI